MSSMKTNHMLVSWRNYGEHCMVIGLSATLMGGYIDSVKRLIYILSLMNFH